MVLKTKFVEDYLHADIAGKIELDNSIIKLRK